MVIKLELYIIVVRHFYKKLKFVKGDFHKMKSRKSNISTTTFDMNIFSEDQSLGISGLEQLRSAQSPN